MARCSRNICISLLSNPCLARSWEADLSSALYRLSWVIVLFSHFSRHAGEGSSIHLWDCRCHCAQWETGQAGGGGVGTCPLVSARLVLLTVQGALPWFSFPDSTNHMNNKLWPLFFRWGSCGKDIPCLETTDFLFCNFELPCFSCLLLKY